MVLKKIFPFQEEVQGKFDPNWEGPYIVKKELSGGVLILTEMDDDVFPELINSDSVKRFYVNVKLVYLIFLIKMKRGLHFCYLYKLKKFIC